MLFTTKEEARNAGLKAEWEINKKLQIIKRDAEPTRVDGVSFFAPDQIEDIYTRWMARLDKLIIPDTAQPVRAYIIDGICYDTYQKSDCRFDA